MLSCTMCFYVAVSATWGHLIVHREPVKTYKAFVVSVLVVLVFLTAVSYVGRVSGKF